MLGVVLASVVVALTMLCAVLDVAGSASALEEVGPGVIGAEVTGDADANVRDLCGIFAPDCPSVAYSVGVSLIS